MKKIISIVVITLISVIFCCFNTWAINLVTISAPYEPTYVWRVGTEPDQKVDFFITTGPQELRLKSLKVKLRGNDDCVTGFQIGFGDERYSPDNINLWLPADSSMMLSVYFDAWQEFESKLVLKKFLFEKVENGRQLKKNTRLVYNVLAQNFFETGLKVKMATDGSEIRDHFIKAGSLGNDVFVGAVVPTTIGPSAFTDFEMELLQQGSATASDIHEVCLVTADGYAVACANPMQFGSVLFEKADFNGYYLPGDTQEEWFIQVYTKTINTDPDGTGTYGKSVQYTIGSFKSVCEDTGEVHVLQATPNAVPRMGEYTDTVLSKTGTITGAMISALANDLPDGILLPGNREVGKFKLAVDSLPNEAPYGEPVELVLAGLKVKFQLPPEGVVVSNVQARFEGDSYETVPIELDADNYALLDLQAISGRLDHGEYTLVIEAEVRFYPVYTPNPEFYIITKIENLDTDISWNGNSGWGDYFTGLLLPYQSVVGGKLWW